MVSHFKTNAFLLTEITGKSVTQAEKVLLKAISDNKAVL